MKQVLLLMPGEAQWWRQVGRAWEPATEEGEGPVWVVTNLAEESLAECKAPRLFGPDRSAFVARQVAGRFPDTPYRGAIPTPDPKDPFGALVPTRFAMFGVDAADRINAELDRIGGELAGVWPLSMLMGIFGAQRSLAPDLFVVMPGPETLRIVYLKNRVPILTRLTLTHDSAAAHVDEIVRTIKYLENIQAVPRDRKEHALLYLGASHEIDPLLPAGRLVRIDPPRERAGAAANWHFPLFDIVVKSPKGQVAPMGRRIAFLSSKVRRMASVLSVMVVLVSLLAASSNLLQIYRSIQKRLITTERMEEVNQDVDQLNAQISSYKVSPDLVRKAVALAAKELDSVATIQPLLLALTNAMATDPNLRLREFQWRLLEAGTDACLSTMSAASAGGDAKQPGSEARRVELSFQLELPGTYGPRDRAAALRAFAAAIASIDRITVLRDAYREQASGTLRGGSIVSAAGEMTWCVTVPGDTSSDGADAGAPKT